MFLIVGSLIEILVMTGFLYLIRKRGSFIFRTLGVIIIAYIVANTIYWLPIWLGVFEGKHLSSTKTFVWFWTVLGYAVGSLAFWHAEGKKHLKKNK